jgi:hypothetical protein
VECGSASGSIWAAFVHQYQVDVLLARALRIRWWGYSGYCVSCDVQVPAIVCAVHKIAIVTPCIAAYRVLDVPSVFFCSLHRGQLSLQGRPCKSILSIRLRAAQATQNDACMRLAKSCIPKSVLPSDRPERSCCIAPASRHTPMSSDCRTPTSGTPHPHSRFRFVLGAGQPSAVAGNVIRASSLRGILSPP